jgi:hypothetical protein
MTIGACATALPATNAAASNTMGMAFSFIDVSLIEMDAAFFGEIACAFAASVLIYFPKSDYSLIKPCRAPMHR